MGGTCSGIGIAHIGMIVKINTHLQVLIKQFKLKSHFSRVERLYNVPRNFLYAYNSYTALLLMLIRVHVFSVLTSSDSSILLKMHEYISF